MPLHFSAQDVVINTPESGSSQSSEDEQDVTPPTDPRLATLVAMFPDFDQQVCRAVCDRLSALTGL